MTGNSLIDAEHKQLFDAINDLMDACAQGVGREKIMSTTQFLNSYVNKHFGDEEKLQVQSKYPGYAAQKQFHDGYKRQLSQTTQALSLIHIWPGPRAVTADNPSKTGE